MRRMWVVLCCALAVLMGGSTLRAEDGLMGPMPDMAEPGRASTTGTWLAVTGSEYLDVTVSSTEVVRMAAHSIPRTIMLRLEPAGGGASARITVGGLPAGATFYIYDVAQPKPIVQAVDAGGTLSLTLDISSERVLYLQPDHSTYFLGETGWTNDAGEDVNGIVGTWDPVARAATVLGDLGEAIQVTADNLVLDGGGHTLAGTGVGAGITINSRTGVTLRNFRIRDFSTGISSYHCANIVVERMDIRDCGNGMYIDDINVLAFRDSVIDRCATGIYDYGFYNYQITISNNTFSNITGNGGYAEAGRNMRYENNVFNRCGGGLGFLFSIGNAIVGNVFANSAGGVRYDQVHQSPINGNVITGTNTAIYFYDYCNQNVVTYNELSANGLGFGESSRPAGRENAYNSFYRNNVIGNAVQITTSPDVYYADYYYAQPPTGGNYWSDWTGPDADGNGFVDLPYVFTANTDLYPQAAPVALPNHRPVLETVGDRAAAEGSLLEFTVTAYDVDGDPVTLAASNLPAGAQFDPATGAFSWVPGYDQAGSYPGVEFVAADDASPAAVSVERITIAVANVNRAPVLQLVGAASGTEYHLLQFTVTAQDPDGDAVALLPPSGLPAGASFDVATGIFTWTPVGTQVGGHPVSFFAVDDGSPAATGQLDVVVTVADDTVAPWVVSTYPANLAIDVPRGVVVRVTYGEPILAGAAFNSITIKKGKSATAIQRAIVGDTLILTPASALSARSTYTVSIPANALKDAAGNNVSAYGFSFTTGRN